MLHFDRRCLSLVFVLAAPFVSSSPVFSKDYNLLGKSGFALWRCASFGILAENKKYQDHVQKLFVQGHEQLSALVTDMVAGKVKDADIKDVPVGVTWSLTSGPSVEFRMGYMWAQFQKEAYDKSWPNLKGVSFDEQKSLQKISAETEFSSQNCQLLVK